MRVEDNVREAMMVTDSRLRNVISLSRLRKETRARRKSPRRALERAVMATTRVERKIRADKEMIEMASATRRTVKTKRAAASARTRKKARDCLRTRKHVRMLSTRSLKATLLKEE